MATSSFFRRFEVRPEDEAAWIKAFDTKVKYKWPKNYTHRMLNKEEGLELLKRMVKDQKNEL